MKKKILGLLTCLFIISNLAYAGNTPFAMRVYKDRGWMSTNDRVKKDDSYDPMVHTTGGNQYSSERMDYRVQSAWINKGVSNYVSQWTWGIKQTMQYDFGKGKIGEKYNLGIRLAISDEGVANVSGNWEP